WDDKMRRSVLVDSRADLLTYGMGENILRRVADLLNRGVPVRKIRDVRGCVYLAKKGEKVFFDAVETCDFDELKQNPEAYAKAFAVQYRNTDAIHGKAVIEYYGDKMLVQNPPMPPLTRDELDAVYALPYVRHYHPDYEKDGGVPAIAEVRFSIAHNRGCFGACNFCAIAFHQGREVRSRSVESVLEEAKKITALPDFKGYIHDVGGPTANFREPACDKQWQTGVCPGRKCLAPVPCKNLKVSHKEYADMLQQIEALPKVKKVFIRSGIRFDYLLLDKDDSFFRRLVEHHVSGQLKVAPEHCSAGVLDAMGKPRIQVYETFRNKYFELCKACGKEQYLVPYLMSSHPGSTMEQAVALALWLKKYGYAPEQVQDFYPTPGTVSTVMYATGIHPLTGEKVYVAKDYKEKQMQRALLQYSKPENARLVREALLYAKRQDLIGYEPGCLVAPERPSGKSQGKKGTSRPDAAGKKRTGTSPARKAAGAAGQKAKSKGVPQKTGFGGQYVPAKKSKKPLAKKK
ncbi:MAG: YgiQ family radical SAM protein, partial [Clostridia bacterium]|nr:YgiQ family radical SAM protein [Clostridia bacterium]